MLQTFDCLYCGLFFHSRKTQAKFCTRTCGYAYMKENTPKYIFPCEICGKIVKRKPQKANPPFRCSVSCSNKARAIKLKAINTCANCKTVFKTSQHNQRKYCTDQCARIGRSQKETIKCPTCGKDRMYSPSGIKRNRRYCSIACRAKSLSKRLVYVCARCGKEVAALPKIAKAARFCSKACFHKYRGESGLELNVRIALETMGIYYIREHAIGIYSIDFYLPLFNVALESDGIYWHSRPEKIESDKRKEARLLSIGIHTVRITDKEVRHAPSLTKLIAKKLGLKSLKQRGREQ
jgi:very-short-patch-repair endonuclease